VLAQVSIDKYRCQQQEQTGCCYQTSYMLYTEGDNLRTKASYEHLHELAAARDWLHPFPSFPHSPHTLRPPLQRRGALHRCLCLGAQHRWCAAVKQCGCGRPCISIRSERQGR
jgi:hypothetical protein